MSTMDKAVEAGALARNNRIKDRWDELMRAGKHGTYETLFQIVREELDIGVRAAFPILAEELVASISTVPQLIPLNPKHVRGARASDYEAALRARIQSMLEGG